MPAFRTALFYWLKLGLISFGGPAGQIAIMHQELVEKRRWISESHFLHALNFTMLLPGPEAQQLATYLGWRLHGWRGAVAAGVLFVLPSAILLFFLSWLFMAGGHISWLAAIFYGLIPAVIAVIFFAVIRIGKKTLKTNFLWLMAAVSFCSIYFFNISFVFIILFAGAIGYLCHLRAPHDVDIESTKAAESAKENPFLKLPPPPSATWRRALGVSTIVLSLWVLPILALGLWLGWNSTPFLQGIFFSKAAMVTFGGAYAVLPYVAQQAVENYHWLSQPQMMSGLALAETTPGPLVIVLQFVGFAGGWQNPGQFTPLLGASMGAAITTWATFLPCFLFVLLGAPFVEKIRQLPSLSAALSAITAAVVGVILDLGFVFAQHAIWPIPDGRPDYFVAAASMMAFFALWKLKAPFLLVLGICGILGLCSLAWI